MRMNLFFVGFVNNDEILLKGKLFVVIGVGGVGKVLVYGVKERYVWVVVVNCNYGIYLKIF